MLKYLLVLLILIIIGLMVSNDFNERKLKIAEHQNEIKILNLSGSSVRPKERNVSNETTAENSKQRTCCNSYYELSDKYSLAKLNRICDLLPVEIECMSKCLQINVNKRKEFDLEVSDRIEEWIEQRIIFEEVICAKIKVEIDLRTKELISNTLPKELAKLNADRLSKDEIVRLIKGISNSLGLQEMNRFETEILSSDQQSNKFLVNKRAIQLLSQMRRMGQLLVEENRERMIRNQGRNLAQLDTSSRTPEIHPAFTSIHQNNVHTSQINKPNNQFMNSVNSNHRRPKFRSQSPPPPPRYKRKSIDEQDANETDSITVQPNDLEESNVSLKNYECVPIKLRPSDVDQILKMHPNLTIFQMDTETNNKQQTDRSEERSIEKPVRTRGLLSFFQGSKPLVNSESNSDDLATKLIQQFSASASHENITSLTDEVMLNHSRACHQEFVPTLTELLSLSLRMNSTSNEYKENNRNDRIGALCNRILQTRAKMTDKLEYCEQSAEMRYMLEHVLNLTETSLKYCLNFESKFKNTTNIEQFHHTSESMIVPDQYSSIVEQTPMSGDRSSAILIDHKPKLSTPGLPVDCLNWNHLKSCQNRFIPWFELIEIEEFKQQAENNSIKFYDMKFFKRNASSLLRIAKSDSISVSNCKDVMLFENCVRYRLENAGFMLDLEENEQTNRSPETNKENSTSCQFGVHQLNKSALINNLATRIIDEIHNRIRTICPKLSDILLLNSNATENKFKTNMINQLSARYTDIVNDSECSDHSKAFVNHCVHIYNSQIERSYVQFYKNFELQDYFGKLFVSNSMILPRICCAQRQVARCFITAANFRCPKNKDRTEQLLKMGELSYCEEINSKLSMSKCRQVLSIRTHNSKSSASGLSLHHMCLVVLAVFWLLLNISAFTF